MTRPTSGAKGLSCRLHGRAMTRPTSGAKGLSFFEKNQNPHDGISRVEDGPERIQLRRTRGYRKPEGAVVVARPSPWGNPFPVDGDWIMWTAVALGYMGNPKGRREAAVALYRAWLTQQPVKRRGPDMPERGNGGYLEFADGAVVSLSEHAEGIAIFGAAISAAPKIPSRPAVAELRGKDLAWCPLDQPCHADVLLEVANA